MNGLTVTGLCRGGMFPAADATVPRAAIEGNLSAADDAELEAKCLVLVAGGLPAESKDLAGTREQVRDGIGNVLDHARGCGAPLAIEALHPTYAADRACVNTLAQASALCHEFGDWLVPTTDLLLDCGMMGDGVIDIPLIRSWVESAGYRDIHEVEILSAKDWWRRDPDEVLTICRERRQSCC